jgi:hypothetical protein
VHKTQSLAHEFHKTPISVQPLKSLLDNMLGC